MRRIFTQRQRAQLTEARGLHEAKFTADIYDKAKDERVDVVLEIDKNGTVKSGGKVVGRIERLPHAGRKGPHGGATGQFTWFGHAPDGGVVSNRSTKKAVLRDMAAYSIGVRLLGMGQWS